MDQPALYSKANENSRIDSQEIIEKYFNKLKWRLDKADALLDIGSGPGDLLMELIYPRMPEKFERLVGSDISQEMVDYCQECYKSKNKCDFKVLDIGTEGDLPLELKHKFDHVTSFYCLHWIQNQRQVFENIFKLLRKEGGDCLLEFLSNYPVFKVYKILSKSPKWSGYMQDVELYISPYYHDKDPRTKCLNLLKQAGFSEVHVELKHKSYSYKGLQNSKDLFKAINPFLKRIPLALHDSFMDDIFNIMITYDSDKVQYSQEFETLSLSYDLVIVYAKK